MFIQNKYSKTYYNIIDRAKSRTISGYTEKHHILPKSLGGNNSKSNLVSLTAREHYICHLLLTKFTINEAYQKMSYALHRITNTANVRIKSSTMYEMIRKAHATMLSTKFKGITIKERMGRDYAHPISDYQKDQIKKSNSSRIWTTEMRLQMSISQKQRKINNPDSFKKGPFSLEHKKNISIARLTRVEKTYNFVHDEHGNFTGTIQDLIKHYPDTFTKKYHNAEIWKLTAGLYKSCKGWKLL